MPTNAWDAGDPATSSIMDTLFTSHGNLPLHPMTRHRAFADLRFPGLVWAGLSILFVSVTQGANPSEKLPGTFAPVVEAIAPSVVTVYSKRTVKEDLVRIPFDDPMWRRFFGLPGDGWLHS
jgi:hypothetical protein